MYIKTYVREEHNIYYWNIKVNFRQGNNFWSQITTDKYIVHIATSKVTRYSIIS